MKDSINYFRINQTLKRYPKLYEIFGEITQPVELESYPYKQNKNITEYNFYAILNLPDSSEDVKEEYKIRLKNSGTVLDKICISVYLDRITFKKQILERLDGLCKKLDSIYSNEKLKSGIKNNIFSFLSELEFAKFCQINGFEILDVEPKLNSGKKLDLRIKWRNKPTLVEVITPRPKRFLFCWDEIPGNDNERLKKFIEKKYCIEWLKTAEIEKIDCNKIIRVYAGKNSLELKLNEMKTKVNLRFDDNRTDWLNVEKENSKLNIYSYWLPLSSEYENNISGEFEAHEIEVNNIKEPFIIVVDGSLAGIDEINIQSVIEEFKKDGKKSKFLTGIFFRRGETYKFYLVL